MRKNYLIALIALTTAACERNTVPCIDESKIDTEAVCIQIYDPVCGCDGKTYSNYCIAENAGLLSWEPGECPEQ